MVAMKVSENGMNSRVDRLLSILEMIAHRGKGVALAEISKELDIPKTTVLRMLDKLVHRGYVEYDKRTERYLIGLETILLSVTALSKMEVVENSISYLKELSNTTQETAFLGVYNEGEIVYLYKSEGTKSILMSSRLGVRRPVHCTALGKAILSSYSVEQVTKILEQKGMKKMTKNTITTIEEYLKELNHVRVNGYAIDNEELEEGLGCYAAPVYNYTGNVVAAICVSGPINRVIENKDALVKELKETAAQISKSMGFVPSMLHQ